jgi:hypothetical protein
MKSASPRKKDIAYFFVQRARPRRSARQVRATPLLSVEVVPTADLEQ